MTAPRRRVLFLSPYPRSVASHRVRIEQYVPYLASRGVDATVRSLLDERGYRSGGARLAATVLLGILRRARDVAAAGRFDAVLVHREAVPLPTAAFERRLSRSSRRLAFDFDDAIYLPQPRPRSALSRWIRSPAKFPAMIGAADVVLAGNALLARAAVPHARSVSLVPTTVDTDRITPGTNDPRAPVVIGWIGSPSTAPYLDRIAPALREILDRYPHATVEIVGAAIRPGLGERARARPWSLDREPDDLRGFDIGVMPLPDDEWTRGKCGYKALQYMAAGAATVSSPVGVANEMIDHGRTGLLADELPEWVDALSRLVEDAGVRRSLGGAGRSSVEERYSLRAWAPRFYDLVLGV